MTALEFCRKLDEALARRKGVSPDCHRNIRCEVCDDLMRIYNGPVPGAICNVCMEPSGEGECVRAMPLAITRGTLRF